MSHSDRDRAREIASFLRESCLNAVNCRFSPESNQMSMSEFIEKLQQLVGKDAVISGAAVGQRASHFWDSSPLQALAVVKPASTEEVSRVLKCCFDHHQPVVTHGGVTGLADGEKSTMNDVVLSMERMRHIENLDTAGKTITVQAGCVLQQVQLAAEEAGLLYGVDLGARGSCTVGGNIATNAGGLSVLRYGMTREQVLGLEVVLADGTVLSSMNTLMKNNTGYDLKHLFVGSEGTLGVVTRAVLRLRPATPSRNTALLAFDNFAAVSTTLAKLSGSLNAQLNAFEIIWNEFYCLSTDDTLEGTSRAPLARHYPVYAIVESRGSNMQADQALFSDALEQAINDELILDAVIAQSEKDRAELWQIRENVDLVLRHQPAFIYDISLPIASMEHYLELLIQSLRAEWPDVKMYAYGHLADSNLHITVAPEPNNYQRETGGANSQIKPFTATEQRWYETSNKLVFEPLSKLGGAISAEHGIGLLKKDYLPYSRTSAEIATMQGLKNALDPRAILNPGKIVDRSA